VKQGRVFWVSFEYREDSFDALLVYDLDLGVGPPLEAVDCRPQPIFSIRHHPFGDCLQGLLSLDLSNNEGLLLLVNIEVFLEVWAQIEWVLSPSGKLLRQICEALHKLPRAFCRVLDINSLVDLCPLKEEALIHELSILAEVQVLHLFLPEGVGEAGYLLYLSLIHDLYEFELMISFIKALSKRHLILQSFQLLWLEE